MPWAVLPNTHATNENKHNTPTQKQHKLDLFPRHRGAASSVQGFITLSFNALLAGVLAPWLADSALHLAIASACLYGFGLVAWRWYRAIAKRAPPAGTIEADLLTRA